MLTQSLIGDLKYKFRYGNVVVKLIFANIGVFLAVGLLQLFSFLFQTNSFMEWLISNLEAPASLSLLMKQPWSVLTYMFLHKGVFHVLFNMLWLYWFGEIFILYLGDKKILPLYLIGGLAGAGLYILAFNVLPVFKPMLESSYMLGASASVFAIVFGATTLNPDHEMRLLLIGDVKIKYIALVSLLLGVINIPMGNPGGNIAHVGGALSGFLFIKALRSGVDLTSPFRRFFQFLKELFNPSSKMKVTHRSAQQRSETNHPRSGNEQERVDAILDKIARSGYDGLTKEEKDFLFHYSKK
ncbi:MAG: rhomboid family intramembrane serine protease [Bacteroidetes bacterium]|nr:rhomboid family intramembrane serine protease [Bacteroidota bacterium]